MRLIYPLHGIGTIPGVYKTQGFSDNPQIYQQFGLKGHNGIDWAAPKGTPVLAAHDGRLITKPQDPDGYGIYVRVQWEEDGLTPGLTPGLTWDTVYGHFERINGQDRDVKAGEVIGYVDSTGFSTGHHLHFGIRQKLNGQVVDYNNGYLGYIDPEPYFYMTNVKLLKNGSEYAFYVPATSEEALIDKALNFGYPLPTLDNGKRVDWANLKPDIIL